MLVPGPLCGSVSEGGKGRTPVTRVPERSGGTNRLVGLSDPERYVFTPTELRIRIGKTRSGEVVIRSNFGPMFGSQNYGRTQFRCDISGDLPPEVLLWLYKHLESLIELDKSRRMDEH